MMRLRRGSTLLAGRLCLPPFEGFRLFDVGHHEDSQAVEKFSDLIGMRPKELAP
jgi:hypothetical protein